MDMKKILIILAVSVGLNCFFVGFESARLMQPPAPFYPERQPFPFRSDKMRGHEKHALKEHVFKLSDRQKEMMKENRKRMEESKKEVGALIAADDFDENRLRDALTKAADLRHEIDNQMQETFLENIKTMAPEERKAFVESMKKMMEGKPFANGKKQRFHRPDIEEPVPMKPREHVREPIPEPAETAERPFEEYPVNEMPVPAEPEKTVKRRDFEKAVVLETAPEDIAKQEEAYRKAREERRMMKRKKREERRRIIEERQREEERRVKKRVGKDGTVVFEE